MFAKQHWYPCSGVPNKLNKLPKMCFKFPFNLIGKSTMEFLIDQLWCILKSWYTGGGPEHGFQCCFADLTRGFSSICEAGYWPSSSSEICEYNKIITALYFKRSNYSKVLNFLSLRKRVLLLLFTVHFL